MLIKKSLTTPMLKSASSLWGPRLGPAVTLFLALTVATPTRAEFLLTMASGVYQDTQGRAKVVVSNKEGAEGLFVMDGVPISPQEFDLGRTAREGSQHIFVRFDQSQPSPSYTEIVIEERAYKINGNATIKLNERTSIGIDNNNPYLTVVTESVDKGKQASILAFTGLQEVFRGSGAAATLLAANQLDTSIAEVIKPYALRGGELFLNDRAVSTPSIGILVKPDSECLKQNTTTVLTSQQVGEIRALKGDVPKAQALQRFTVENKKNSPLKDHLVLKAEKRGAVLLNIRRQDVRKLTLLSESVSSRKVCMLSDIDVG